MYCRVCDLRYKDVINVCDGTRLGFANDVEIDSVNARVISLIIYGRSRLFGLLGREEDTVILWNQIEVIGEDTILVHCPCNNNPRPPRRRLFERLFGGK